MPVPAHLTVNKQSPRRYVAPIIILAGSDRKPSSINNALVEWQEISEVFIGWMSLVEGGLGWSKHLYNLQLNQDPKPFYHPNCRLMNLRFLWRKWWSLVKNLVCSRSHCCQRGSRTSQPQWQQDYLWGVDMFYGSFVRIVRIDWLVGVHKSSNGVRCHRIRHSDLEYRKFRHRGHNPDIINSLLFKTVTGLLLL